MQRRIRYVHPFPARMAPDLALDAVKNLAGPSLVLDPMAGSGTSLAAAQRNGHSVIGFDTDPLAALMTEVALCPVAVNPLFAIAEKILTEAALIKKYISRKDAYPEGCDLETVQFIRYWFDPSVRVELAALARAISCVPKKPIRKVLWCAFSRMIITKSSGVSLAMDVSHSRPHKVYERAPQKPFEAFLPAVRRIATVWDCVSNSTRAIVRIGDARKLPLPHSSVDMIITSPPYLNAIDYMRGHKLALAWMGYTMDELRHIRGTNVGSERQMGRNLQLDVESVVGAAAEQLPSNRRNMLARYVMDMDRVLAECSRVAKVGSDAVFVVGNSNINGVYISNSAIIAKLGEQNGFKVVNITTRSIPSSRRYLPPPSSSSSELAKRMRQEVVIRFRKKSHASKS